MALDEVFGVGNLKHAVQPGYTVTDYMYCITIPMRHTVSPSVLLDNTVRRSWTAADLSPQSADLRRPVYRAVYMGAVGLSLRSVLSAPRLYCLRPYRLQSDRLITKSLSVQLWR